MTTQAFKPSLRSQISHELRTPLSGIIGLIQFLNETPLNQEQQSYLMAIQASANQLLDAQSNIETFLSQCEHSK